ncbi:hypothetical protein DPEC_G00219990 [Dallia pectoralis]|uniref:Uncharacterized protein n=1 Tax=Dallia pectoralis TaxID=75939 RepID=A0ACC2G3I1_DALPE|nr:hypothetical protein DPEC_G00219990 [Dallia pectoralis]
MAEPETQQTEQPVAEVFDRVFNALQRARHELASSSSTGTSGTNILTSTRSLFRRRGNRVQGQGVPAQESVDGQLSTIELNWSLAELNQFVCQRFPMISLNLEFTSDLSSHHQRLPPTSTESVENLERAQSPGLVVLPVPGTPEDLETIDERHMRTTEEPAGGIPLKFSFPDGTMKIRRFHTYDPMQALFGFVGSHASATEYFNIRETMSGTTIINTVSGTLLDHNIISPLNIHVRWMDMEDVQTIHQQRNRDAAEVPDLIEVVQRDFGPTQCGPAEEIIDYLDIMPETEMSEPDEMELTDDIQIHISDYLSNAGCLRAVKCLKDKDLLLKDILLFQVVNRLHGPLERPPQTLTADSLDELFVICFSTAGSNKRVQENIAVAFWRDYLQDAEGE